jgi:hypothetical protein
VVVFVLLIVLSSFGFLRGAAAKRERERSARGTTGQCGVVVCKRVERAKKRKKGKKRKKRRRERRGGKEMI